MYVDYENVNFEDIETNEDKFLLNLNVLETQKEFIETTALNPAFVGGFGSGKTEAGFLRTLHYMIKNGPMFKKHGKQYVYGVYEPTVDLIKTILYPRFENKLAELGIKYDLNKTEARLSVPMFNTIIYFRSMDNEERIIGYEHADFWIDELDTLAKDKAEGVFNKIIGRNRLSKPNGEPNTGCATTTPEGKRFVFKKWVEKTGIDKNSHDDFIIIKGKTMENPFINKDYVRNLLSQYPAELAKAYLEGEFVDLTGNLVYPMFNEDINKTNLTLNEYFKDYDKNEVKEIHIGMDFNVYNMSAVIAVHNDIDNELLVLEEISGVRDTPAMIKEINRRYEGYEIFIYPDAAAKQTGTTNASESDLSLLRKEKYRIRINSKNPRIRDRVLSVNALFLNGIGESRLFINTRMCPNLKKNLINQIYDKNTEQPDKTQGYDHMLDSLGYLVWRLYPIRRQIKTATQAERE